MLDVVGLNGWYGKSHILRGIDLRVGTGETTALLGRNGVGKTTTMRAIAGVLDRVEGSVELSGEPILGRPAHAIAQAGLSLVPEHRGIFASLTVAENLRLAARPDTAWPTERIWDVFPSLAARRKTSGGKLSGGEQQMLAIGRALVTGPRLLLLDEPTEGLAPVIVDQLVALLGDLKQSGLSILLVEQSLDVCLAVADDCAILDGGRIVWTGNAEALQVAEDVRARYLTLEHA